ncbi:hypothetical protein QBC45DRAFT_14540 [Copromyces sp. CBS 386.78]|nr:hypothetical protein QBC45DRAFT_14540 [Copromyces sp. CBS 386.78]
MRKHGWLGDAPGLFFLVRLTTTVSCVYAFFGNWNLVLTFTLFTLSHILYGFLVFRFFTHSFIVLFDFRARRLALCHSQVNGGNLKV